MDEATARTRLESMTAWDSEPTLTSDQVTALLALGRRSDDSFRWVNDDTEIARSTAYGLGDRRVPAARNGHIYLVTTAGTTAVNAPTFPTGTGGTVTDGTVVWTEAGGSWVPTFDLSAAAAEGWRWKAAKVAGQFDYATDGQTFDRTGKHAMCLAQAQLYQNEVQGSIRIKGSLPILTPPIIPIPADDTFPV